jgi:hypothetical protein
MNTMVGLRDFFNRHCYIPCKDLDDILERLSNLGVKNKTDLRGFASVWNLKKLGLSDEDINNIMSSFFAVVRRDDADSHDYDSDRQHGEAAFRDLLLDHGDDTYISRLTR